MDVRPFSSSEHPLGQLELHPRIHSAARRAKLNTLRSVLNLSTGDLIRRTGLSRSDVNNLLETVSTVVTQNNVWTASCLQLYQSAMDTPNHGRLTTGCPSLDKLLRGGLLIPGINEVAGTSAAGKTQLCLQLCLMVQLPQELGGLAAGAVYVCTEDAFPSKRWKQLAAAFISSHQGLGYSMDKMSDKLYIEHAATISSLSVLLQYKLPNLLSQQPVRLVVIDSLAALFRVELGEASQAIQRAGLLRDFGHRLKMLSEQHSAAVVCVNQVTAVMDGGTADTVKPALGLTWADIVTTRLLLTRPVCVESSDECSKHPERVLQTLQVLLAPHLPYSVLQYYIDSDGIKTL